MASGGESLLAHGIALPDITVLGMHEDVDKGEESDGNGSGKGDDEPEQDGSKDGKEKKAKWWNKERAIKDAVHYCENACGKLTQEAKVMLQDMSKLMDALGKLEPAELEYVRQEKAILKTKHEALSAIFESASELSNYLAKFDRAADEGAHGVVGRGSSSQVGGKIAHTMGSAPPCGMYKFLQPLADIASISQECCAAETKEHLEATKKKMSAAIAPVRQLLGACKTSKADVEKRRKSWTEKLTGEAKRQDALAPKRAELTKFFDNAFEIFDTVPTVRISEDLSMVDWTKPCVLTGFVAQELPSELTSALNEFQHTLWPKHVAKAGVTPPKRGVEDLDSTCQAALKEVLAAKLPDIMFKCDVPKEYALAFTAGIFVINADVITFAWEPKLCACLRITTGGGARKVVIVNISEMMKTIDDTSRQSLNHVRNNFKAMNTKAMKLHKDGKRMAFASTVGAGDMLYLPPGMMFAEHTSTTCFGLKIAVLPMLAEVAVNLNQLAYLFEKSNQNTEKIEQLEFAACVEAKLKANSGGTPSKTTTKAEDKVVEMEDRKVDEAPSKVEKAEVAVT